jgi:hypothetical protein
MRHLLCCLLLSACHQGDDSAQDSATPDPAEVPLAGACALAEDFGGFLVRSDETQAGIDGAVADGVVPISVLEQIAADGDCMLLRRNNPFCEPACDPGWACDFDGTCLPWPVAQDLGTVTLTGLAGPVEMEPVFPGNTYFDTSMGAPLFEPGALITLRMPGGVYGPATMHGVGFEPLAPLDTEWSVGGGQDLLVHWQAPTGAIQRAQIALSLTIDLHGATPGTLRCAFEDDGEASVPAAILQTLIDTGVTGFPRGTLERHTEDHTAAGAGCMDLTVMSSTTVAVDVVGYTPCTTDVECPEGMECNEELQICE